MRITAIAAGALLATAAASASAQVYYAPAYDPYYGNRLELRAGDECWNPRAGHFEAVRPGEVQNDLDFSRCRVIGARTYDRTYEQRRYYGNRDYYGSRDYGNVRQECWNPRAGHYEEVRAGELQNDLDFGRCRMVRF